MNTAPDLNLPTATAATDTTKAAATPRIKLSSHGFSIDHPIPELGGQLLANALGVADRGAMHGISRRVHVGTAPPMNSPAMASLR
jgi:hypothetical protein